MTENNAYLVLGFQDHPDLENFHTTVMYFGETTDGDLVDIALRIGAYLAWWRPAMFKATYSTAEMFGDQGSKDTRVLIADNPELFLQPLRAALEPYNGSEHNYRPHVTTDLPAPQTFMVDRLVLSRDNYRLIKEWKLQKLML